MNDENSLIKELDKIEVKEGINLIHNMIIPFLDISNKYVNKVKALQKNIENQNMVRGALKSYKYKKKNLIRQAENNVQQVKNLILEGNYLLYSMREKITGEGIIFRTVISNEKKKKVDIVEIPYKTLFGENDKYNFITFKTKESAMEATLTFLKSSINKYHTSQLQQAISEDGLEPVSLYNWRNDSKTLYIEAIKKWDERNKGKKKEDKKDSFNKGHLFEYIDQLNILRQRNSEKYHKRGNITTPWSKSLDAEVDYIFDHAEMLMDHIIFIKGGDTLNAQNKLINASISSLESVLNVFEGTDSYPGIIKSFEAIKKGKKDEELLNILMSLFSKQDEDLSNDILSSSTEEAIQKTKDYIINNFGLKIISS